MHGVEGYCGSAIQTGVLDLGPVTAPDTAVLHIHAVNPYGFSHSRRATHENIDLNRNFVDFSAPLPVNDRYAEIHDLLLPPEWPPTDENESTLDILRRQWGARGYQRAVGLGQYAFEDGIHYGGREPAWSNFTFRQILRKYAQQCRRIGSIDVHTGLGPYGNGERIFACPDEKQTLARARRWWGDCVTSVNLGTSTSIPMTGPIQFGQFEECRQSEQTNVCLEFGTHPLSVVLPAMRAEHWLHRHGSTDTRQAATIRQAFKDAFYPQADDWQPPSGNRAATFFCRPCTVCRTTPSGPRPSERPGQNSRPINTETRCALPSSTPPTRGRAPVTQEGSPRPEQLAQLSAEKPWQPR